MHFVVTTCNILDDKYVLSSWIVYVLIQDYRDALHVALCFEFIYEPKEISVKDEQAPYIEKPHFSKG